MIHIQNIVNKNRYFWSMLILMLFCSFSYSQNLTGPTIVAANSTHTYIFNNGLKNAATWTVTGGTVISVTYGTAGNLNYIATIQWGAAGLGSVAFNSWGETLEVLNVTISAGSSGGGGSSNTNFSNENYVHTLAPRIATTNTSGLSNNEKIESITYFDGLGRGKQSIGIRSGGNEEDIISHSEYDQYGRMEKEFLPFAQANNGGLFLNNGLSSTNTFYNNKYPLDLNTSNPNPFSEKEFEASPLNRVLKQAAPGNDWRMGGGHEIKMDYLHNKVNEVRRYRVTLSFANNTFTPTLVLDSGYYTAGELYKSITKDENHTSGVNHTTEEFKDSEGRVILKRTYGTSTVNGTVQTNTAHDTYYVYDDYGNLSYVLPPKAEPHSAKPDATELSELCYQYKYDHRNRLVEKKIPGKGWEYIVYNKLDQPILTQDANQRSKQPNEWSLTKYDAFGRVAYTGIYNDNSTRIPLQNALYSNSFSQYETKTFNYQNINGVNVYYTNGALPTGAITIYTINYYDNYTFDKDGGNSESAYGITPITNVKGLATGSKVRVLGTSQWITSVTYYDEKSRPIYIYSKNNYLNTTDKIKSNLAFDGTVKETTTTHARTGFSTITTVDQFTYDHMNRLIDQKQSINGASQEVIVKNNYDEIGQLESKSVGGKTTQSRLQNVDYTYNIRGWLKQINDVNNLGNDLFSFKINYNEQETLVSGATQYDDLFNGNISQSIWKTANDNVKRGYSFNYDDLNRIKNAASRKGNSLNLGDSYSIWGINYDKNGNILVLQRNGIGSQWDNLSYNYETSSNKLKKVTDYSNNNEGFKDGANTSTEYTYDANGNMLTDLNKGISSNISYNHLNLPTQVNLSGGNIQYIYDATGVKQKKIVSSGTTTIYAGNYIYENNALKFFNHPEGYVEPDGSGWQYVYQYKDHLGNIRLAYSDETGNYDEILDSDFESDMDGWVANGSTNPTLENGRLKVNVNSSWEGIRHELQSLNVNQGETYTVKIKFDKGNTISRVRFYIQEFDANGNHLRWSGLNWNIQTGEYSYTYTVGSGAKKIFIRLDKDNANTTTETQFYVDYISFSRGQLEIREENNYYPFGLKHKGYNDHPSGVDHPYGYNGVEESNDPFGYDVLEMDFRMYDPAIARFNGIDPVTHYSQGTSVAFDNNPIYWADPSGADSDNYSAADHLYKFTGVDNRDKESEEDTSSKNEDANNGRSPDDIVITTKDPVTGEQIETVRILSNEVFETINLDAPYLGTVNPVTNSGSFEPIIVRGFDSYNEKLKAIFGEIDAFNIKIGGGFAGGGGLGGEFEIALITSGEDMGGIFLYGSADPVVNLGLGGSVGVEFGATFSNNESQFNSGTFEGFSTSLSAGAGLGGGTITYGRGYKTITSTLGVSVPTGLKIGGYFSFAKSKLIKTLKNP